MKINYPYLVAFLAPGAAPGSAATKYVHKTTKGEAVNAASALVRDNKGGSAVLFEAKEVFQVPPPVISKQDVEITVEQRSMGD